MMRFPARLLWPLWALAFTVVAVSASLLLPDAVLDRSRHDASITLHLGDPSPWRSSRFEVPEPGHYDIQLRSIGDNGRAGRRLIADFEVAVVAPDEEVVAQEFFHGIELGHALADGEEVTPLHELKLEPRDRAEGRWTLKARVFTPDVNFDNVPAAIDIRRDSGQLAGLTPLQLLWLTAGAVALPIALFTAVRLAARRRRVPLAATLGATVALAGWIGWVFVHL